MAGPDARGAFEGDAADLSASWTRQSGVGIGRSADDPAESFASVAKSGPDEQRMGFGAARFVSADTGPRPDVLLVPNGADAWASFEVEGALTGRIGDEPETWSVGQGSEDAVGGQQTLARGETVPSGMLLLKTDDTVRLRIGGSWKLLFYDTNVVVHSDGSRTSLRSGEWTENETLPAAGSEGVTRDEYAQILELTASGLHSQFVFTGTSIDLAGAGLKAVTEGALVYRAATGTIVEAGSSHTVKEDEGTLRGITTYTITAAGGLLTMDLLRGVGSVEGSHTASAAARPDSISGFEAVFVMLGVACIVALLVALIVASVRAVQTKSTEMAEMALLTNRPARALRIARAVLRKDPLNPDALFIIGTVLLQRGHHEPLVSELGAAIVRLPDHQRPPVAFQLAIAHVHLNHLELAREHIRVASVEPVFRRRFALDPFFSSVRPLGATRGADVAYG